MKASVFESRAMVAAVLGSAGLLISQAALAQEPVYRVLSPVGEDTVEMIKMAPRLDSLNNKTVCMVSNSSFKVNITMPALGEALKARFPGIKVVPYQEMQTAYSGSNYEAMPGQYRDKGCQAIISGNGG
jgi:hypothetical protein